MATIPDLDHRFCPRQKASSMPALFSPLVRRTLAAATGAAVAAATVTLAPRLLDDTDPERILLSPTADPSTSQTITWRAGRMHHPIVELAPLDEPDNIEQFPAQETGQTIGTHYAATATGLEPGTTYQYRVGDTEEGTGTWHNFTTATQDTEPFTFLYFGDVQTDISDSAAPVVQSALEAEPDAELAVHAGDLVDHANNDHQWAEWFDAFGPRATGEMNHVAAPGNHEYWSSRLSDYWTPQFPSPGNGPEQGTDLAETVYYTDYQGVRFVSLNSNYRDAVEEDDIQQWLQTQRDWLSEVLHNNPNGWTVVTFHHPIFSTNPDHENEPLRQAWLEVLEEHDVDLVLQGHDHSYSRGNMVDNRTEDPDEHTGPVYAVSVTGPKMYEAEGEDWSANEAEIRAQATDTQTFQTVTVDGDTMHYLARTADGTQVDAFTIVDSHDGKRVVDDP